MLEERKKSLAMLRCAVQYQHPKRVISRIGSRSSAVRFKFTSRVVVTSEQCFRHRLNAASVAKLAHQICNLRAAENIICGPHSVKPGEDSSPLMRILSKALQQCHLIKEVWGLRQLAPLLR